MTIVAAWNMNTDATDSVNWFDWTVWTGVTQNTVWDIHWNFTAAWAWNDWIDVDSWASTALDITWDFTIWMLVLTSQAVVWWVRSFVLCFWGFAGTNGYFITCPDNFASTDTGSLWVFTTWTRVETSFAFNDWVRRRVICQLDSWTLKIFINWVLDASGGSISNPNSHSWNRALMSRDASKTAWSFIWDMDEVFVDNSVTDWSPADIKNDFAKFAWFF